MHDMNRVEKLIMVLLIIVTAGTLANALWMLLFPLNWFDHLPALVPEFGTFNIHFVRDMGCAFLTVGIALWWGILNPLFRYPVTVIAALFYSSHAVIHIYDTARGYVGTHHWWVDFPTSYLPAIVLVCAVIYMHTSKSKSA